MALLPQTRGGASSTPASSSTIVTDDDEDEDEPPKENDTIKDKKTNRSYIVQADTSTVKLSGVTSADTKLIIDANRQVTIDNRTYTIIGFTAGAFSDVALTELSVPVSLCKEDSGLNAAIQASTKTTALHLTLTASGTETKVPDYAFLGGDNGNTQIVGVTFGDGITEIGAGAFSGCFCLREIKWGGVTIIGEYAFAACGITYLDVPAQIAEIPKAAFQFCGALETLVLRENMTTIHQSAFENCQSLTTVYLPKSLAEIKSWAFKSCYKLQDGGGGTVYYAGSEPNWGTLKTWSWGNAWSDTGPSDFSKWPTPQCNFDYATLSSTGSPAAQPEAGLPSFVQSLRGLAGTAAQSKR